MTKDEWITAAFMDDMVVVELLLRLKHSSSDSSNSKSQLPVIMPPLGWGHRQQRSKLVSTRKESTRCSPTTPLSWSGGAGGSASPSDGYDESNRPSDLSSGARSKGPFTNEINSISTTNKRSRRKKTFTELKEEESSLLKERIHLKGEIASLRVTMNEQRTRNETLKRIKLYVCKESNNKIDATSDAAFSNQCYKVETFSFDCAHSILPRHSTAHDVTSSDQKGAEAQEKCFILPDLNVPAYEEEIGYEASNGMS